MSINYDSSDENSILNYAKELDGKSLSMVLKDSNNDDYIVGNKGSLGHIVEKGYFGYDINSCSDADFGEVGVELKVVPVKEVKKKPMSDLLIKKEGLSVKERVVLSIINFDEIVNETWETSAIHKKLDKILMMFYLHKPNVSPYECKFIKSYIWEPFLEDIPFIKKDWEFIKDKVVNGKAHELSEGDTLLLGACTKGANKSSTRNQPNSKVPAMQRAYSLKRGYVDHIFNVLYSESNDRTSALPLTIYDEVIKSFATIKGKNLEELREIYEIDVNRDAKQFLASFVSELFSNLVGLSTKDFNEQNISNISIKTIIVKPNFSVKEGMSFEQIRYDELVNESWEDSAMRNTFENKKMLWVVFQSTKNYSSQKELDLNQVNFLDLFYWNIPNEDLDTDVKLLWEDTVSKVKDRNFNCFKKMSETTVAHIRPKAKNSDDTITLTDGTIAPKKTYWLNAKYVAEQIKINVKND